MNLYWLKSEPVGDSTDWVCCARYDIVIQIKDYRTSFLVGRGEKKSRRMESENYCVPRILVVKSNIRTLVFSDEQDEQSTGRSHNPS